jgi:ABC-type sugar transport system ATPase subunit
MSRRSSSRSAEVLTTPETGAAEGPRRYGVEGATHDYSGVVVLRDVDFELESGTVHALIGANGSGKSTLIKILTGALRPAGGRIYTNADTNVRLHSPHEAERHGVGVVHQDYHLFPHLTVTENIAGVTQAPPRRRWTRLVDKDAVDVRVAELLGQLDIELPSRALVGGLDPAERKLVEIARAMVSEPGFLILDEPTASLEPRAARSVLDLMEHLRDRGVGLVFVSHRLDEVTRVADQVTVLRDGVRVAALPRSAVTEDELARLLVAGTAGDRFERRNRSTEAKPALSVSGLTLTPEAPPISFSVNAGEVIGFTGLIGSGASTIVRMVGGAEALYADVRVAGEPVRISSPRDAMRAGIGFIPEDRGREGLLPEQSVSINVSLAALPVSRTGVLQKGRIERRAHDYSQRLRIRARSIHAPARTLSGGNQQKVLLARSLASGARVLTVEEPTHGIDVGAKAQVHDLLLEFADTGGAILVSSTDVGELLAICDRIVVMRHGAIVKDVPAADLSEEAITVLGARDAEQYLESLIEG